MSSAMKIGYGFDKAGSCGRAQLGERGLGEVLSRSNRSRTVSLPDPHCRQKEERMSGCRVPFPQTHSLPFLCSVPLFHRPLCPLVSVSVWPVEEQAGDCGAGERKNSGYFFLYFTVLGIVSAMVISLLMASAPAKKACCGFYLPTGDSSPWAAVSLAPSFAPTPLLLGVRSGFSLVLISERAYCSLCSLLASSRVIPSHSVHF